MKLQNLFISAALFFSVGAGAAIASPSTGSAHKASVVASSSVDASESGARCAAELPAALTLDNHAVASSSGKCKSDCTVAAGECRTSCKSAKCANDCNKEERSCKSGC
jgi:hypothetical protein